jgi:hypothetical protein
MSYRAIILINRFCPVNSKNGCLRKNIPETDEMYVLFASILPTMMGNIDANEAF